MTIGDSRCTYDEQAIDAASDRGDDMSKKPIQWDLPQLREAEGVRHDLLDES